MWNCRAAVDEYEQEEARYGHGKFVETRFSYLLTPEYREAASHALTLASSKQAENTTVRIIGLFTHLEALISEMGVVEGCAAFLAESPGVKNLRKRDAPTHGPSEGIDDLLPCDEPPVQRKDDFAVEPLPDPRTLDPNDL